MAETDRYLTEIASFDPSQLHFFDESGVTKILGNRNYSSSPVGQPAFEIQKYTSNANFTKPFTFNQWS